MDIVKLMPKDGNWLFNGDVFSDEVTTLADRRSEWTEVTDEYRSRWEAEHTSQDNVEPTIEEQNDALLQYVNDKTNGNYADLSAAVEGLVNNN